MVTTPATVEEIESVLKWKHQAAEAEKALRFALESAAADAEGVASLRAAFDRAQQSNVGALGGGSRALLQESNARLGFLENECRFRELKQGAERRERPHIEALKKAIGETVEITSPGVSPRRNSSRAVNRTLFGEAKRLLVVAELEAELERAIDGGDSIELAHVIQKVEHAAGTSQTLVVRAKTRLLAMKVESELQAMMAQRSPSALWDVIAQAQLREGVDTLILNQALQCHASMQAEVSLNAAMHGKCAAALQDGIKVAERTGGVQTSLLISARQRQESLAVEEALRYALTHKKNDLGLMKDAMLMGQRIEDYNPAVHVLMSEARKRSAILDVEKALDDAVGMEDAAALEEALAAAKKLVFSGSVGVDDAVLRKASYLKAALAVEEELRTAALGEDLVKLRLSIDAAQRADLGLAQRYGVEQARLVRPSVWSSARRQQLALELRTELERDPHPATVRDYVNRAKALDSFDLELLAKAEDQLDAFAVQEHVRRCALAIVA